MDENEQRIRKIESEFADVKTEVALVKSSAASIERTVTRLEDKFDQFVDTLTQHFVPRVEHSESQKNVGARLDRLEAEIQELRAKSGKLPAWGQAVFTVMVSGLSAMIGGHYLH
jgi:DNA anti-recombination protein RmuC